MSADEEEPGDLTELTLAELMEVEVTTASKAEESSFEAPGIISVVTPEEIRRFDARTVEELLNRVTGAYVYGSYFYGKTLSLRGDLPGQYDNHVLLLINGRPFRDSSFDGVSMNFYQALPVSAIDHIEVVRGPGSVLYGSAAYVGVVNVITRKGEEQGGMLSVGGGSWETVYADASYGFESDDADLKASLAAGLHSQRGWRYTATDETIGPSLANEDSENVGSQRFGSYLNVSYKELSLDGFLSYTKNDVLGVLPIWPMQKIDDHQRYFLDGQWSHPFSENLSLTTNVTYNYSEFDFIIDDPGPFSPTVTTIAHSLIGEISSRYSPFEPVNLTGGFIADYRKGKQEKSDNSPPDIPSFSEWWWSGYLQVDYSPIERLKLVGGFQCNKPPHRPVHWVPRAGVIISITDQIGLKGLYGEAYRAPSPFERDVDAPGIIMGNSDLDPETIRTWEAEINFHRENIQASLAYYHSSQDDLIMRQSGGSEPQYFNLGEITFQGIELDWKYAVTTDWYLVGSYRYQWNKDESGDSNFTLVPNHMFKVGASYDAPLGIMVSAFYSLLSRPESLNVPNVNPDPEIWHLLDLNVELDVNRALDTNIAFDPLFAVRGTNLLDTDMDFPEFVRRNLNSLPQGGGTAVFVEATLRF